jgi:hypothetical protein
MNKSLVVQQNLDVMTLADVLVKSGFFTDTRQQAQAVVKVLAGQELGFGPIASMTSIHIVKGRPVLSANLMAALVKRHPRYGYRVAEHTSEVCTIAFFEDGEQIGTSQFTTKDATAAGLMNGVNWQKYPRNMLFARALSNGVKWHCPDVLSGTVYTPDEMDKDVDEDGSPIIEWIEPVENDNGRTEPAVARDMAWAASRTTPKGTLFGELDRSQLQQVIDNVSAGSAQDIAARMLLDALDSPTAEYPNETIAAVIEAGLTKNVYSAKNTLAKAKEIHPNDAADIVVEWFDHYRTARGQELSSDDAATYADEQMNEVPFD